MDKRGNVHINYAIVFLVIVIICLLTVKWGEIPDLVGRISFALTLTSLILSVLTIIYAFFSNSSITQSMVKLDQMSEGINGASQRVASLTQNIDKKLEAFPHFFADIDEKINKIPSMLTEELSKQKPVQSLQKEKSGITADEINNFLSITSIAGLMLLKIFIKAYSKHIPIDLKEICNKFNILDYSYAHGFTIAISSLGLIDFTQAKEESIWNITEINSTITEKLLEDKLKSSLSERAKDEESRKAVEDQIKGIDDYLNKP